ncbi:unnamed protein product [Colletotrichum noveboracense]|uniref:Uncharacterized protein n=1 Tax=Colletotrichum noveboracense TaxID=2664923 RepID=A0A9W4WI88_9PEZI|nr:unnamed protein product [Colletotrichum noveboracense]
MTSNREEEQRLELLEGPAQTRKLQRKTALHYDARMTGLPSTFLGNFSRLRTLQNLGFATLTSPEALSSHAPIDVEAALEQLPPTPASGDLSVDLNQADDNRLGSSEEGGSIQIDELIYEVPVSSDRIWRFHGSSIYVAPAEELLSQAMRDKWKDFISAFQTNFAHVKAEMIAEQCKRKQLRQKGCNLTKFMLEVRISGRRETPLSRSIEMGPCLWILCGSKWCQKRVREVAQQLTLPVDLSLQQIEIHTGFPVPNALETVVPMSQLLSDKTINWGLNHFGGHILYHLEGQELASGQFSACGLLCCATYVKDGKVVKQHISRIGGLLTFGKSDYQIESENTAVTTAHGVFDRLWSLDDAEEDEDDEMEEEGFSSGSESSGPDRNEALTSSMKNTSIVGEKHASEVQLWLPLTVHAVKYLSRQFPKGDLDNEGVSASADYAILGSRMLRVFENIVDPTTGITITTHAKNEELTEGPIVLLLGSDNNYEGTLLPGTLKLSMGDSEVAVRKLWLGAALAPGTSGTWLIRESKFCGMIIAAYPGEPLALFMTAEDILGNIEVTFPGVLNMDVNPSKPPECKDEDSKSGQTPESSSSGLGSSQKNEIEPETSPPKQESMTAAIKAATRSVDHGGALDTAFKPDQRISQQNTPNATQQLGSTSRSGQRGLSHNPPKSSSEKYEYQWVWTCVSNFKDRDIWFSI